jgi:uncharacterized protein (DUF302 family)
MRSQVLAGDPSLHDSGVVSILSNNSVDDTVSRIEDILWTRGIRLFALIDLTADVERTGTTATPTRLLIFGDMKVAASMLLVSPTAAIDLPSKLLVWRDGEGRVWISCNTPQYFKGHCALPDKLMKKRNFSGVESLASRAAE